MSYKKILFGIIAGISAFLFVGCNTIVNGDPIERNKTVIRTEVIHYHVFMSYDTYNNQVMNADHRKQRGRTAPNRAIEDNNFHHIQFGYSDNHRNIPPVKPHAEVSNDRTK